MKDRVYKLIKLTGRSTKGIQDAVNTALRMAEHFRDHEHRDLLLPIDNIFRFIQARMQESRSALSPEL